MQTFFQLSAADVISSLKTSASGLKSDTVVNLRNEFGENVLQEAKRKSKLSILIGQFKDVMILILIVAAAISFMVGEHTDAYVILAIILGNAWMGYSQEYNAEQSVKMLQKMSAQFAIVIRDNNPLKIEASQLVPGDLILLEAGDIVPADARLIQVSSLKTDEASLTGESHSIEKITEPIKEGDIVPGDQLNMVFKGTVVSNGSAQAVVTAIGMNTEIGKIAGMMEASSQKTPLQKRLAVFSKQLAVIVLVICLTVFGLGLLRGEPPFAMFLTALSLAVAALPEALPAVITIALAQGARRMVSQNALMRKLPAVETLGSVTYICSDKTGTLTQNIMTVESILAVEGKEELLGYAMMLNNDVRFSADKELLGDSTETALVKYAIDKGKTKEEADQKFPLLEKLPFDSERMRMGTLHKYGDKWILFVKGAPIKMLESVSEKHKNQTDGWLAQNRKWAADGLRVLFFAYKIFEKDPGRITSDEENELEFLGMAAMIDPPREEVIEAIKECKSAGIKTVMITGDQPLTATAIAQRLGMIEEGSQEVRAGSDLEKLTEEEFKSVTKHVAVYARVSPEQKLNIVKALQNNGEFVAMTGDGVNDAPSLKQSDIGIAMGITGTDVSKEASDMILLDDNFATIVKAVREGRRIYENIKKFIVYVLSCNLGEILVIFFAPIIGFAIPLLPIHILWINLVTDGLPGIALVAEPAEKDIMNRPPRPPKENLFAGGLVLRIVLIGIIMTFAALFIQWWCINENYDVKTQQTAVFTTLCFVQLGNALSVRSTYHSIFSRDIFANRGMWGAIILTIMLQMLIVYVPFLDTVFKTTPLSWHIMLIVIITTVVCIILIELVKLMNKK
ncbi:MULTISPECIES: cation-translocating P-type ATPase [Dyadobacter]|uniref:Cation-translocating P-type ATPase n=2 Tax=Dyadobacter TaxID=120831 RepID=A0A9X1P7R3_9BACT|nr:MULTISPECIES: cation-translocating P-type ATPase [Dyadobacter]MCF0040344.1 cation-translocating P-type ATPase [Dyadobacter fanqingshengii]MCF2494834.1 cation-translocating P-type ATPase [Dyadobacter chenhuakuii]MCF2519087.1 cation-translocating P-type ATPase [Dyadobacter sp. CY351]USJ31846.1 cation-translocating P-type ATPase [Dyadobacter chenhuakuii]USJ37913.1 cation-translocating P-type ATPase [Dyadobacter fanqingshengii]